MAKMLNKFVHLTFRNTLRFGWLRHLTPKCHYNQNATDKGVIRLICMFEEQNLNPRERDLLTELERLNTSFEEEDYFRVIMLSIQLTVEIIDALATRSEEFLEDRISISDDDRYVYKLSSNLSRKESDRLYIVNNLVAMYEHDEKNEYFTKDDFSEYFNELAEFDLPPLQRTPTSNR